MLSKVVCVTIRGKVSECDHNLPMYRLSSYSKIFNSSDLVNKFIDYRDDNSYDTIHAGSQVWLVENLNYRFRGSYFLDSYDGVPAFGYIAQQMLKWRVLRGRIYLLNMSGRFC